MKTIFEKSQKGQKGYSLPVLSEDLTCFIPSHELIRKTPLLLPEVSELDLMRHYSLLARRNIGIDTHFYPLGSCTMKYNPRIKETCAALPDFSGTHPLAPEESVQGNLILIDSLIKLLCGLTGMDSGSLFPNAGAQGEFVGIKMIAAYHAARKDSLRTEMLIPDNAHGTNPATAAMAGFKIVPIQTASDGDLDFNHLQKQLSPRTAGLMLTNPNTLGLFSQHIENITAMVHEAGGLLYYDGANLNPLLEIAKPGMMGFDVMHLNLHKTFSTPHGGGGPGAGPVLCKAFLSPYLPLPKIIKEGQRFHILWDETTSIGQIASFFGNFGIYLRAYVYILMHGRHGLRRLAEGAILNANYLKHKLKHLLNIPYPQICMHEFVAQVAGLPEIKASDIAKRLLDFGVHAPTVNFPLIVKECFLIEPTEGESKETLDEFVEIFSKIIEECKSQPERVKNAPHQQSVRRLDEVRAVRQPIFKHVLENDI